MNNQDSQLDEFTKEYRENIFPSSWKNPTPAEMYDLVVIGGGPGGMSAATLARDLQAKVALVEKAHLGGECFSSGCIPSKAFLSASRRVADIRNASEFGIEVDKEWKVDFGRVIQRVHRLQAILSPHDSAEHFKQMGIDVFLGEGHFVSENKLEVKGAVLPFKKALIITGTKPAAFNVPGIQESDYYTNETIFMIKKLPPRLAVIGAGPIGCELSQGFHRLGSQVTLITTGPYLLPRDDSLATERLRAIMEKEGMTVIRNSKIARIEKRDKEKIIFLEQSTEPIVVDEILVSIGRVPVVKGLKLDAAGVSYDEKKGIITNSLLQTSNPNIYAAGDVSSPFKFTHMSIELAHLAVQNALQNSSFRSDALIVPWCTYTDPEIAHIGLDEKEAEKRGLSFEKVIFELKDVERAVLDGESAGFAKLLVLSDSNQIIGATIMARHAGDMISEISVAMAIQQGLLAISHAIHPFPTQGEVMRRAAEALLKQRKLSMSYASKNA